MTVIMGVYFQMHQQQLIETRTKRQVEISEIDGRLSQEYEDKLYASLQEIRDQYEGDLRNSREEIKLLYEDKVYPSFTIHALSTFVEYFLIPRMLS